MTQGSWSRYLKVYDPLKAGSIDGTDTRPHDRGIERAIESVYVPDKNLQSDPMKTLFVGRLNPETTEETLRKAFSKYGEIKSLNLIRDIITGFSKQYAFIEFDLHGDADEACQEMHGNYLDNHNIFVDWECGRVFPKWLPRRLGGGLGGRKESGQLRFGGKDRPFKKPFILSNTGQGAGRGREEIRGFEEKAQRGDGRGRDVKEMDRGYNRDKGYRSTRKEGSYEPEYRERRGDRSRDRQRDGYRERSQEKETDRYKRRDRGRDKYEDRDGYHDDRGSYRRDDKERYRDRRRDRKESEEKVSKRRRRGDSEERKERQDGRNERSERYGQTRRFTEEKVATREGNGSPDRDDRRKRRFIEGKREGTSEYSERYTEGEKKPWSRRKFTETKGEEDP
ncbi:uncharacterized protein [Apostichopus japonicus]|uniref:uncharacterized protein n=1 Tax=Stichopus japonicus TaxID=307972 RepID=UPI003AB8494B